MSINKSTLGTIVGAALLGLVKKHTGSYARTKTIKFATITANFRFKKTVVEDVDGDLGDAVIGEISLDEALDQLKTIFKAFKKEVDCSIDQRYRAALDWLAQGNQIPQDWIEENEGIFPETPEGYAESYSMEDEAMSRIYYYAKRVSGLAELEEGSPSAYNIWYANICSSLTAAYGEKLIPHSIEFIDGSIFENEIGTYTLPIITSKLYAHYPLSSQYIKMFNKWKINRAMLNEDQFRAIIGMVVNLAKDISLSDHYYDLPPTKKGFIHILSGLHSEFIPGIYSEKTRTGLRLRRR
jgi:hypothetical protein